MVGLFFKTTGFVKKRFRGVKSRGRAINLTVSPGAEEGDVDENSDSKVERGGLTQDLCLR